MSNTEPDDLPDVIASLFANWIQRSQALIGQLEANDIEERAAKIASDDPEVMERMCRWLSDPEHVREIRADMPGCWKLLGDLIAVFALKEQN